MKNNSPIVESTHIPETTPTPSRFKCFLKFYAPEIALLTVTAVSIGIAAPYIYKELKNPQFMDEALELRLIAEGKI